jgi:integrase
MGFQQGGLKMARARRGYGEGSIFQRADGRWSAAVSAGYSASGKRIRKTIYGATKKEVQDEMSRLQSRKASGKMVSTGRLTVAQHLETWLTTVAFNTLRAGTYYNYEAVIENHIGTRIGGVQLQKLTATHLQAMYAGMTDDKVGPNPRRLAHAVLRLALKHALRRGLVMNNACDAIDPPTVPKAKIKPLDEAQVAKLLTAAVGDRLEALYHLAIGSGMREGEIFGLHWNSLDLAAGTVSVRQSLSEVSGKLELGEPKSKAGRRLIGLPQHALKALEDHRKRQMAAGFGGVAFVFCNQSGGPLRRSHFHAESFKPLLAKAGLPPMRFHDLRHTHATLCLLAGENPKVIQERLGHANISITLDTYSHLLPSMTAGTAGKLDAIITAAMAENENGCQSAVKAG